MNRFIQTLGLGLIVNSSESDNKCYTHLEALEKRKQENGTDIYEEYVKNLSDVVFAILNSKPVNKCYSSSTFAGVTTSLLFTFFLGLCGAGTHGLDSAFSNYSGAHP